MGGRINRPIIRVFGNALDSFDVAVDSRNLDRQAIPGILQIALGIPRHTRWHEATGRIGGSQV